MPWALRNEALTVPCLDAKMMMVMCFPRISRPAVLASTQPPHPFFLGWHHVPPESVWGAEQFKNTHDVLHGNLKPHVMSWQVSGTHRYK